MTDPTRLVVVTSGFGLWTDGRHELSARWSDVTRVSATASDGAPALLIALGDGRQLRVAHDLPGFAAFVSAAPAALGGAAAPGWHEPIRSAAAGDAGEVVLYARRAPRQRSLQ